MTITISVNDRHPKLGVSVLVLIEGSETQVKAQWLEDKTIQLTAFCTDKTRYYDKDDDAFYLASGWYEVNEFGDILDKIEGTVTHWTLFPESLT